MTTASPSFGFFTSSEELSPEQIISAARTAEAAGFDRLWVSDHYHPWMSSEGSSPFVWSVLGALAATTSLKLTTAVTCPTFRIHPAVIAQATATTAVMAPGRFTFGVGAGEALNEHILGDAWPPVSIRHARLTEALDIIRRLWTGEVVTHEGTYFTVHDAKLFTVPETPPEILVSGFGPESTKLAASIGDGWITTSPDADGLKSDSLQAVRARFERLGLDVSWHGAGTVSLRADRLDAFLLALSECLENVRRHSGLSEAHVTITDDEATVRALVTDNGVGFEPAAVPAGKLGYRESIVGRIEEAGGTARVFSAQGSGTTVVLEMPR